MLNRDNDKPYTILVVDDDLMVRILMRESFEQDSLLVVEAENGAEALKFFENNDPDLVLMDVNMPEMDGFTACLKMRNHPKGKDLPIVLVTGLDDIDSIRNAFEAGATDFITKPVNWPILNHRVRYLLRGKETMHALRQSENRLSQAQRIAKFGNWEWDLKTNSLYWSDEIYRILRLNPDEYKPSIEDFLRMIRSEDRDLVKDSLNSVADQQTALSVDYQITLPNKTERSLHQQGEVFFDDYGHPQRMYGTIQDISERKKTEEQIRFLAYFDVLTGLPNRQLFKEYATQALAQAQQKQEKVGLIYLDLDQFKRINDTLGHTAGDELLVTIANFLKDSLRASDITAKLNINEFSTQPLSRLGGDEFTILLPGLIDNHQAASVAKRIMKRLNQPIRIEDQEFYVTSSMGIAIYPEDGNSLEALLKNADTAMYHAKEDGRNAYSFYAKKMSFRTIERLGLEAKLKKALEKDQLILHYQPQVDSITRELIGLEALVRWADPQKGLIPPGQFIPIAEETGLILPIGNRVLEIACAQAKAWQKNGYHPIPISVNISSHQFQQQNLLETVQQALHTSGLKPEYLELELTESAVMHNVEKTIATLQNLKKIGLKLSIDDFGTGYSSMSYLKRFPLDTLKIDRSFVKDITTDPNDAAIIKAIVALSKSLGLKTIAEGVETEEQANFITQEGCDQIQGYLISKPLPTDQITAFFKRNPLEELSLSV